MRANPGFSQKEIVNLLGIKRDSVGYFLRDMVNEGKVEDSREGKYTTYRISR